jgi:hypothetical protein
MSWQLLTLTIQLSSLCEPSWANQKLHAVRLEECPQRYNKDTMAKAFHDPDNSSDVHQ